MKSDGVLLENRIQKALKDHQARRMSFFHRFADSKAAKQYLPVQPGDFLWLLPGVPAVLLEAKSTLTGAALQDLLRPGQTGKHRLWLRAGHLTAFVYSDLRKGSLAWYPGNLGLRENVWKPVWTGGLGEAAQMLLFMEDWFHD